MDALMFLLKLAYDSRYRLPMLLTIGFMALDIRMQLEINIHTRQVHRQPRPGADLHPRRRRRIPPGAEGEEEDQANHRESEASNDSWMTIEDEYDPEEMEEQEEELILTDRGTIGSSQVSAPTEPTTSRHTQRSNPLSHHSIQCSDHPSEHQQDSSAKM